jgi:High potential iron-sulfur protein
MISRRHLLILGLFTGSALADAPPPKVNEKDSMAQALGYVSDAKRVDAKANPTYKAGSTCSTCSWYQGKPGDPAGGACTFFPGKNVDAGGWCRMWNNKQ